MSKKQPEEYEDIPGTWVFDAERARRGYHLNAFFYSLMKPENRAEFLADERKYLQKFPMTEEQREACLNRAWNKLLELGGVSYAIVSSRSRTRSPISTWPRKWSASRRRSTSR